MKRIEQLYNKYISSNITDVEKQELFELIDNADDAALANLANSYLDADVPDDLSNLQARTEQLLQGIKLRIAKDEQKPGSAKIWKWLPYAAAIIAIITGIWIYEITSQERTTGADEMASSIVPGRNSATITLANGKVVALSGAKDGVVVGAKLTYLDGTDVNALDPALDQDSNSGLQTINTPRGGQYTIALPDGTRVWLNSASSLTYDVLLNTRGNTRFVKLIGEAYFEVAKSRNRTFVVESKNQLVQVLGTHFNISAYQDDYNIKTTLLEGSVRVSSLRGTKQSSNTTGNNDYVILKPGQQAINVDHARLVVKDVETDEAVAWKNGEFLFNKEPLESIMLKISRWYDVKIKYEDNQMKNKVFWASVTRSGKITDVLKVLELTGDVHFEIEGRTIIVKP